MVTDSIGDGKPDALFVVSLDSGEKRQLSTPAETDFADTDPAISPTASGWPSAAISPRSAASCTSPPFAPTSPSRATGRLVPLALYPASPGWMPDSTAIVFSAKAALWRLGIDGTSVPDGCRSSVKMAESPTVSNRQADATSRLAYVRSYTDTNIWKVETVAPGVPAPTPPALAVSSTRGDFLANVS